MEKVWGAFHRERCSDEYKALWSDFLLDSIVCTDANPIFYQHITDIVFRMVLRKNFPTKDKAQQELPKEVHLSYEERNVVRYIGGYVLRALKKKVERSSNPETLKKELILCLCDLLEDETAVYDDSSDWLDLKNRGGLNHVSQNMFLLISSMEIEVKSHLTKSIAGNDFNLKEMLSSKIMSNENVENYWETLSANWGEKESEILLSMIVDHWITIRGFAYTSAWMERYKSSVHKKVQKSKGIRKTVMGTSSTSEENVG